MVIDKSTPTRMVEMGWPSKGKSKPTPCYVLYSLDREHVVFVTMKGVGKARDKNGELIAVNFLPCPDYRDFVKEGYGVDWDDVKELFKETVSHSGQNATHPTAIKARSRNILMTIVNKSPIASFMVTHRDTGEVMLQTSSFAYFYRSLLPETDGLLPHLAYYANLEDGQSIDITDYRLDGHPRFIIPGSDHYRSIFISTAKGAIIDLRDTDKHPEDNWLDYVLANQELQGKEGT